MTVDRLSLEVPGPPRGKGRPRFTRNGRPYTPADTIDAEDRVRTAWELAGRPRLPDGAFTLHVDVHVKRPKDHRLRDGTLSAAGRRAVFPTSRPDLDNVVKLIADALNGLAWHDDAHAVNITATRLWSPDDTPRIHVEAYTLQCQGEAA